MNKPAKNQSSYVPTFTSSASALRTLRTGKSNPNWQAAAEYLMERAAPDVRLLVEAATQIQMDREHLRTDRRDGVTRASSLAFRMDLSGLQWLVLLAAGSGLVALLIWIAQNATLRVC